MAQTALAVMFSRCSYTRLDGLDVLPLISTIKRVRSYTATSYSFVLTNCDQGHARLLSPECLYEQPRTPRWIQHFKPRVSYTC